MHFRYSYDISCAYTVKIIVRQKELFEPKNDRMFVVNAMLSPMASTTSEIFRYVACKKNFVKATASFAQNLSIRYNCKKNKLVE